MADESITICDVQGLHLQKNRTVDDPALKWLWIVWPLLLACFALASQAHAQTTIRVNAGGPLYTDSQGRQWAADYGYSGGTPAAFTTQPIAGTSDPTLFLTERWGVSSYNFTVPNGNYLVKLYFAENAFSSAGIRVFGVDVEGATLFSALDIYDEVGSHAALVRSGTFSVADGQLNIAFTPGIEDPNINAIEIVEVLPDTQAPSTPAGLSAIAASASQINLSWSAATDNVGVNAYLVERCQGSGCSNFAEVAFPTGTVLNDTGLAAATIYRYRIRAGDAAGNVSSYTSIVSATTSGSGTTIRVRGANSNYTDSQGQLWLANTGLTNGNEGDWGNISIAGTSDPALYRVEQYGSGMQYAFTVPNGTYQVRLHFSENDTGASVGSRVFNVAIEGTTVFSNLDVYAQAGGSRTALIKTANNVAVSDGQINILFTGAPDTPMVQAVEILGSSSPGDSQAPTAPTGLSATVVSASQINLSWGAATDNVGVNAYLVERCQGAGCSNFAEVAFPTGTVLNDTGLAAATTYRYRIRAGDAAGNVSSYTSIVSATTSGAGTTIRVRGANSNYTDSLGQLWLANTGLTNGNEGDWGNISIAGTSDPTLYRVEQYGNGMQYAFTVPNGTYQVRLHFSENSTGASVGSRVFNVAIEGNTVFSNLDVYAQAGGSRIALIKTASNIAVTDGQINILFTSAPNTPMVQAVEILGGSSSDSQAPTTPTGLTATAVSASQINLSWGAATDNVAVTNYLIERCAGSGCSNFIQIATSATSPYSDSGLLGSTSYSYRVRAVDAAQNAGNYSSTATATTGVASPPSDPTNLHVIATSASEIDIGWSAAGGATGYLIERCQGAGCANFAEIGASITTKYFDMGRAAETSYTYRVRAAGPGGQSGYTTQVTTETLATAVCD